MKQFLITFSLGLILSGQAFAEEEFYTLFCRGGAGISVTASRDLQVIGGSSARYSGVDIITFVRSDVAAGSDGKALRPGTCAWADRGMFADEPNKIYQGTYSQSTMTIYYQTGKPLIFKPQVAFLEDSSSTIMKGQFMGGNSPSGEKVLLAKPGYGLVNSY